jgi:hypothetical protein
MEIRRPFIGSCNSRLQRARFQPAGDRGKLLALRFDHLFEDSVRLSCLVRGEFEASGKPSSFQVLPCARATGGEWITTYAATVGRRRARIAATAPAGPMKLYSDARIVRLRRRCRRLLQQVQRENAPEREVGHQVGFDIRSSRRRLGVGISSCGNRGNR